MEEGKRRLKNCSPGLSWETKGCFLIRLIVDMMNCGHTENFRRVILRIVIARYEDSLSNHLEGRNNLYRTKEEREIQKRGDFMYKKDT